MAKPTQEEILEAIKDSRGIISNIASKLGVEWHTAKKYAYKYKKTTIAIQYEIEKTKDKAENNIADAIYDEKDIQVSKWYLNTIGKDRGYVERTESKIIDEYSEKTKKEIEDVISKFKNQNVEIKSAEKKED